MNQTHGPQRQDGHSQRPHRQEQDQHKASRQLSLGRFGEDSPQALFQLRNALSHDHNGVEQLFRVPKEQVQHKAQGRAREQAHGAASFV